MLSVVKGLFFITATVLIVGCSESSKVSKTEAFIAQRSSESDEALVDRRTSAIKKIHASLEEFRSRYPISSFDMLTWHNQLSAHEFISLSGQLTSSKPGCRIDEVQDPDGVCWPNAGEICQKDTEELRGALSDNGFISLICLPSGIETAERRVIDVDGLSMECDSYSRPGFILVGDVKRNGDQVFVEHSCQKPVPNSPTT